MWQLCFKAVFCTFMYEVVYFYGWWMLVSETFHVPVFVISKAQTYWMSPCLSTNIIWSCIGYWQTTLKKKPWHYNQQDVKWTPVVVNEMEMPQISLSNNNIQAHIVNISFVENRQVMNATIVSVYSWWINWCTFMLSSACLREYTWNQNSLSMQKSNSIYD